MTLTKENSYNNFIPRGNKLSFDRKLNKTYFSFRKQNRRNNNCTSRADYPRHPAKHIQTNSLSFIH